MRVIGSLRGRHNAQNAAAAVAVVTSLGVGIEAIREGQQCGVDLGAANHEQDICIGCRSDSALRIVENLGALGVELRVMRDDKVPPAGQGAGA